jgi:hypothetical protein
MKYATAGKLAGLLAHPVAFAGRGAAREADALGVEFEEEERVGVSSDGVSQDDTSAHGRTRIWRFRKVVKREKGSSSAPHIIG